MVELVYTTDLKSVAPCGLAGSSPAFGTIYYMQSLEEELKEEIASLLHEWWQNKWKEQRRGASRTINGYLLLDKRVVERLEPLTRKEYSRLAEEEKEKLLEVADKIVRLFNV